MGVAGAGGSRWDDCGGAQCWWDDGVEGGGEVGCVGGSGR